MGRFFGPDLDQERTALNGASGRLARANRIPHSHTATDYDSHTYFRHMLLAHEMSACHLPGSYELGEARKLRHSTPDSLPPLTISVWYILRRRRRQRRIDDRQPANPPTSQQAKATAIHSTLTLTHTKPTARAHLSRSSVPFTHHTPLILTLALADDADSTSRSCSPHTPIAALPNCLHNPLPCALTFRRWMRSLS